MLTEVSIVSVVVGFVTFFDGFKYSLEGDCKRGLFEMAFGAAMIGGGFFTFALFQPRHNPIETALQQRSFYPLCTLKDHSITEENVLESCRIALKYSGIDIYVKEMWSNFSNPERIECRILLNTFKVLDFKNQTFMFDVTEKKCSVQGFIFTHRDR